MRGQWFNLVLWFLDETHIVVTALTALTFLWTKSAHVAYFIAGALSTNIIAKGIKKFIRQPRPIPTKSPLMDFNPSAIPQSPPVDTAEPLKASHLDRKLKAQIKIQRQKTFGMPSTHSASISFYMVYIAMALYSASPSTTAPSFLLQHRVPLVAGTMLWGGAILCSRVYLGYHTVPQVLAGAMLGGTSGYICRRVWKEHMKTHGEKVLQQAIDRTFRFVGL